MKTNHSTKRLIMLALALPMLLTLVGVQLGCLFPPPDRRPRQGHVDKRDERGRPERDRRDEHQERDRDHRSEQDQRDQDRDRKEDSNHR